MLQFVAEISEDSVAECEGWDESGNKIVHFLVVEKRLAERPEDPSLSVLG